MKTIALATQKGGSGKSTLCRSLAVAAQEGDEQVAVIDMDRQGTLSSWWQRRESNVPLVASAKASELKEGIAGLGGDGFTVCFIDTAGMDRTDATEATRLADFCIVPVQPSIDDIESCLVTAARLLQLKKPFIFVINEAEPQLMSTINRKFINELEAWGDGEGDASREARAIAGTRVAEVSETLIVRRMTHRLASREGQGVTEYEPNGKAAKEIRALWADVAGRCGLKVKKPKKVKANVK